MAVFVSLLLIGMLEWDDDCNLFVTFVSLFAEGTCVIVSCVLDWVLSDANFVDAIPLGKPLFFCCCCCCCCNCGTLGVNVFCTGFNEVLLLLLISAWLVVGNIILDIFVEDAVAADSKLFVGDVDRLELLVVFVLPLLIPIY